MDRPCLLGLALSGRQSFPLVYLLRFKNYRAVISAPVYILSTINDVLPEFGGSLFAPNGTTTERSHQRYNHLLSQVILRKSLQFFLDGHTQHNYMLVWDALLCP